MDMELDFQKKLLNMAYSFYTNLRIGVVVEGIYAKNFIGVKAASNRVPVRKYFVDVRWLNLPTGPKSDADGGKTGEPVEVMMPVAGFSIQRNGIDVDAGSASDLQNCTLNAWGIFCGIDKGSYVIAGFTHDSTPIVIGCIIPKADWVEDAHATIAPGEIRIKGKERQELYLESNGNTTLQDGTTITRTTESVPESIKLERSGRSITVTGRKVIIRALDSSDAETAIVTIDTDGSVTVDSDNIKLGANALKGVLIGTAADVAAIQAAAPTALGLAVATKTKAE